MNKIIIVLGVIIALIAISFVGLKLYTKSFSPQETERYGTHGFDISVDYSRPFKNDRNVFGELVPYGKVWRTGANEATIFTTNIPLQIQEDSLPVGSYSLFTIPGEEEWEIIFNAETGQWGVSPFDGMANRDPEKDILKVTVPTISTQDVFEQFTITFDEMGDDINLIMMWDQTMVVVPFTPVEQ
jgi:hypothetical protein